MKGFELRISYSQSFSPYRPIQSSSSKINWHWLNLHNNKHPISKSLIFFLYCILDKLLIRDMFHSSNMYQNLFWYSIQMSPPQLFWTFVLEWREIQKRYIKTKSKDKRKPFGQIMVHSRSRQPRQAVLDSGKSKWPLYLFVAQVLRAFSSVKI